MTMHDELLRIFRQVVPAARGVVLATPDGRALASDAPGADALAGRAAAQRTQGESALVDGPGGPYLVVFMPGDGTTLFRETAPARA